MTKAEFVALLAVLAKHDRESYERLRDIGWSEAIPLESEDPN